MRALSTFEGVGRSLDPTFSLVSIAKPYLLPLMTSSGSGTNDLFNELGRQVGALSSKAVGIQGAWMKVWSALSRAISNSRFDWVSRIVSFRRMIVAQQSIGQAVLLGCLALATAIVGASSRPLWSILPAAATLPVGLGWFRMQMRMRRDQRLEQLPGSNR